jgi:hypothetical protein
MNLITELRAGATPNDLRRGWHLHSVQDSPFLSIYLDGNFRVLATQDSGGLLLFRVLKHDDAYRQQTLSNDRGTVATEISSKRLMPSDIYHSLLALGLPAVDAAPFKGISDEDALLEALSTAQVRTRSLVLSLYETTGVVLPKTGMRMLHQDSELQDLVERGADQWQVYLHPSQEFIVSLPVGYRAAVVGSAGTGKTVSAWHRTSRFIKAGHSVGFACANEGILAVSQAVLATMTGPAVNASRYLVPREADDLVQLSESVDHIVIDEGQEIPVTWLQTLGNRIPDRVGFTLFYDLNQLGGNIPKGDTGRYRRRVSDWKTMIGGFPRLQPLRLTVNYRNSKEVAEHYLALLSDVLPAVPLAEVPTFESGEVAVRATNREEVVGVIAGLLRRLLQRYSPGQIGVAMLARLPSDTFAELAELGLSVTHDLNTSSITVATAAQFRGHERKVMIVIAEDPLRLRQDFGSAIDAYIAMSRAIQQLIVIELR